MRFAQETDGGRGPVWSELTPIAPATVSTSL